ncbi:MAG TPA: hypothetical protein VFE90_03530 [Myxococcales bacterium]|nr:hypothetical protein [Myxococcales bacterium]
MKRLVCAAALACAACAGGQKPTPPAQKLNRWGKPYKEGVAVPAWVDKVPEAAKGKLVAVGYSQPSFWPQDAINAAAEEARGKLALALTSHVEVLGMDTATAESTGGATIDKEATDVVMQNSRIEATWVDENGERSEPGGVWALAAIEIDSVRGALGGGVEAKSAQVAGKIGPGWLDRLPGKGGKVFATGYSGPTFEKEAAVRYAGENAVQNLAASLRAHVQAYTLLVESASGLSVDQFAQTEQPDNTFLEIVRKNSKVEATWIDVEGARPGDPPGAVWALASIDVQSTKGGIKSVDNPDLAPALDQKGNDSTSK